MASGKSVYLRDRLMNFIFNGGAAFVPPASIWIRLYTTALTPAGVGTEVAAASYNAIQVPLNTTNFPTTTDGSIENAEQIPVGTAAEDWGSVKAWGVWTTQTGGQLLWWGDINPAAVIVSGTVMVIPVGMLAFIEENGA